MIGLPIPASPAQLKADPSKLPYIKAWLCDFPSEGISAHANGISKKLALLGYDSLFSLSNMDGELEALGIPTAHAKMMIRDAGALQPTQTGYGPSLPSVAQKTLKPISTWTDRLVGTHI